MRLWRPPRNCAAIDGLVPGAQATEVFPFPVLLSPFQRTHFAPLVPESNKRGVAAAYSAASFSAVVAAWRPADPEAAIVDGMGPTVSERFAADLEHIANTEAIAAPVQRVSLFGTEAFRVATLEARYLIEGPDDSPAYATVTAFGLDGFYVSIATTVAGPDIRRTSHRSGFHAALARAWSAHLARSPVALPTRSLPPFLAATDTLMTDLEEWRELRGGA